MSRPCPMDLRVRVVGALQDGGLSCHQAAAHYGVGGTAIRWVQRVRRTGSAAPGRIGGYKPRRLVGEHRVWLRERCRSGDFTLRGLVSELAGRGPKVDYCSVWAFVHEKKLSFKRLRRRRAGRAVRPSCVGGRSSRPASIASTPRGWCSSTRLGPRPTWRRCVAGRPVAPG
jgi:putative transposase